MIHGGTYHVMNRGNRKALIFHDDRDRRRFTRLLMDSADEHEVEILSGTQMGTHFHLVITTPHANVALFMQHLEGRFAEYINARYGFVGHLFQGPYIGVVIENDIHLFTAMWYVFANPCQAGLCERFEDWPWSTYRATVGDRAVPSYLSIDWLQTLFPADTLEESQRLFRECMEDPDPIDAYLFAVDPACALAIRSFISDRLREIDQPFSYREAIRPPLTQLFPSNQTREERNSVIRAAKSCHGYTLAEIANALQMHPGSVSRIFCRQRTQTVEEPTD